MKFPRCRKRRKVAPVHETHEPSEATAARIRAEVRLEVVRSQTPMYRALGDSLRELRERNHIADAFERTLRKGT